MLCEKDFFWLGLSNTDKTKFWLLMPQNYLSSVMRIRITSSLSVMQFQTFLDLSYNL